MTADIEQVDAFLSDAEGQDEAICICQADRPPPFQGACEWMESRSRGERIDYEGSEQFFVGRTEIGVLTKEFFSSASDMIPQQRA